MMTLKVPTGIQETIETLLYISIFPFPFCHNPKLSLIKAPLPVVPSNWLAVMFSDPINPAP